MEKVFVQTTLALPPIKIHDVYFDKNTGEVVLHITQGSHPTESVRMYGGDILQLNRETDIKIIETHNKRGA